MIKERERERGGPAHVPLGSRGGRGGWLDMDAHCPVGAVETDTQRP